YQPALVVIYTDGDLFVCAPLRKQEQQRDQPIALVLLDRSALSQGKISMELKVVKFKEFGPKFGNLLVSRVGSRVKAVRSRKKTNRLMFARNGISKTFFRLELEAERRVLGFLARSRADPIGSCARPGYVK